MHVVMRLEGMEKVRARLAGAASKMPAEAAAAMYTSAQHILVPAMRMKLTKNRSIFRGQLFQRMGTRFSEGGVSIEVGALGVPYGYHVERGWKPGEETVDFGKILQYVKKKMFGGRRIGKSGRASAESLAWAIYDTLEEKGAKPHPFVIPAWEERQDEWSLDVVRRLKTRLGKI